MSTTTFDSSPIPAGGASLGVGLWALVVTTLGLLLFFYHWLGGVVGAGGQQ